MNKIKRYAKKYGYSIYFGIVIAHFGSTLLDWKTYLLIFTMVILVELRHKRSCKKNVEYLEFKHEPLIHE